MSIGKAHRLNLSAKIKTRSAVTSSDSLGGYSHSQKEVGKVNLDLLLDKDFEPAKNLQLEELTEDTCKYMEGHPDEKFSLRKKECWKFSLSTTFNDCFPSKR